MIDPNENQLERLDYLLNQMEADTQHILRGADKVSQAIDEAYHQHANGATRESAVWSDSSTQANQHATNKS